jgi:lipoprotein-releasing system permease protein
VNVSLYIANKLSVGRGKTFSSFIVKLCTAATAISVCIMVLGTAIYAGFEQGVIDKFYNCWGNVHVMTSSGDITSFSQPDSMYFNKNLQDSISKVVGVKNVSAIGIQSALLKFKQNYEGVLLRGISMNYDKDRLPKFLISGQMPTLSDSSYSKDILLSKAHANILDVKAGDSILCYVVLNNGEAPRARKLHVSGIYQTGIHENDKTFAIADIRLLQLLQSDTAARIAGYEISVTNATDATTVRDNVFMQCLRPPLTAFTIEERFRRVFQWLNLVKQNLNTVYVILLLVALINIATGLLILVLERTQMIGILKSIGASNWRIQKIFVWQNLRITLIGIVLGVALALLLGFLQQTFHFVKLDPDIYYVDHVVLKFEWQSVLAICALSILIFGLVIVLASTIVKFISPLKAVRFD